MNFRTMKRHIKEGFKSIIRNGWMSFAAISAVSITLLLVGGLIATVMNVNGLASDIEEDVSVRVYIDIAADEEAQENLQSELEEMEHVKEVTFSSREDELESVVGSYGDTFELFEGDQNPLYNVFIVDTEGPEYTAELAEEIAPLSYVSEVNYGGAEADRLFNMTSTIRNIGGIVIVALIFTAVFLISNTIRITIFSRSTEIEIMKLVGATNWFIRWPFLIEGALIGFVGAIIPASILWFVYDAVYGTVSKFLDGTYLSLLEPNPFMYQLTFLVVITGIFIGAIGSSLSIRKFLKV
ncbi:MAG: permease-like cell division protein FtsX [Atopostipes suicloacalis]|nr:permease-like cell division protein FtsX [Atopostipes suicloacalis]MDN6731848.1 permease-like cell division protein FtsX [Atopostipes suicloacalis]